MEFQKTIGDFEEWPDFECTVRRMRSDEFVDYQAALARGVFQISQGVSRFPLDGATMLRFVRAVVLDYRNLPLTYGDRALSPSSKIGDDGLDPLDYVLPAAAFEVLSRVADWSDVSEEDEKKS